MISYPLSVVGLLFLSCLLQQFLPVMSVWHDARILILPLVVLCASATVSTATMLIFAFVGGFLWDAQQILLIEQGDDAVYRENAGSLKFGYSIILYAAMGFLMQGIRPLFKEGKWQFSALFSGIAIFLYLSIEYLIRSFMSGGLTLDNGVIEEIAASSLLTLLLSPFVFWILYRIASLCGYRRFFVLKNRRQRYGT